MITQKTPKNKYCAFKLAVYNIIRLIKEGVYIEIFRKENRGIILHIPAPLPYLCRYL